VDFFVIDLQEGALHQKFLLFGRLDYVHDMVECARDYAFQLGTLGYAHHCECLAAACLTIRKDRPVIALNHRLDEVEGGALVD
jgi:hypothetical protein